MHTHHLCCAHPSVCSAPVADARVLGDVVDVLAAGAQELHPVDLKLVRVSNAQEAVVAGGGGEQAPAGVATRQGSNAAALLSMTAQHSNAQAFKFEGTTENRHLREGRHSITAAAASILLTAQHSSAQAFISKGAAENRPLGGRPKQQWWCCGS